MTIRLRLPELAEKRGLSIYALAQRLGPAWSPSLVYRVARNQGAFKCLTPVQLEALCKALDVQPGTLFERG